MHIDIPIHIERQPDFTTCGPTSLHAVYRHLGDDISLQQVIDEVPRNPGGGTLMIHLGLHALRRGYKAQIYKFGLDVLDPTWFAGDVDIQAKVHARVAALGMGADPKMASALKSMDEYFERGGSLHFEDLSPALITRFLRQGTPLLAGLNGTYLYRSARETNDKVDDVAGETFGHFLLVCGYDSKDRSVSIADPLQENPLFQRQHYRVSIHRLIGAIFLGAGSNDANFLVLRPGKAKRATKARKP